MTSHKQTKRVHKITLDTDVPEAEWGRFRTPGALHRTVADGQRKCRSTRKDITKSKVDFDKFGRIDVQSHLTESSLVLKIQITCNPEHMCHPHDLVPVLLETKTDSFAFTIAVVEPTPDLNRHVIDVEYPLRELATALGLDLTGVRNVGEFLKERVRELGVKAQWLADTTNGGNQANHVSGGVFEKGGSGRIILRKRTPEDFLATKDVRNLEWNMSERLSESRARPVYLTFRDLLAEDKELATTIEAESEFMCSGGQLGHVVSKMDELHDFMAERDSHDLTAGIETKVVCPPLVSVTKETKLYTDVYYDIVPKAGQPYPLLRNRIVLRRRKVASDPEGTFLFTLKGRTHRFGAEALRYAAQVNLIKHVAKTPEGMARVRDLMCDTVNWDNAFAQCFQQALEPAGLSHLVAHRDEWEIVPVFTVTSERAKYSLKFEDNTVLDFSADSATGRHGTASATVHSFELGVGHPGLTTSGTTTATSMDARIAMWGQPGHFGNRGKEVQALITRPFHIWQDVCNPRVLEKNDYRFFTIVRDLLLKKHFGLDPAKDLTPGGNKGSELAQLLGII